MNENEKLATVKNSANARYGWIFSRSASRSDYFGLRRYESRMLSTTPSVNLGLGHPFHFLCPIFLTAKRSLHRWMLFLVGRLLLYTVISLRCSFTTLNFDNPFYALHFYGKITFGKLKLAWQQVAGDYCLMVLEAILTTTAFNWVEGIDKGEQFPL